MHSTFHTLETCPVGHTEAMPTVHLLDYVAGNVRSLVNAINKVGYEVEWIKSPDDVQKAEVSLREPLDKSINTTT